MRRQKKSCTTPKRNTTGRTRTSIGAEFALACVRPNDEPVQLSEALWLPTLPAKLSPLRLLRRTDNHQKHIYGEDARIPTCDTFPLHTFNTPRLCSPPLSSLWVCFPNNIVSHLAVGGVVRARRPESPLTSCRQQFGLG